jgi:hypothetical protein
MYNRPAKERILQAPICRSLHLSRGIESRKLVYTSASIANPYTRDIGRAIGEEKIPHGCIGANKSNKIHDDQFLPALIITFTASIICEDRPTQ